MVHGCECAEGSDSPSGGRDEREQRGGGADAADGGGGDDDDAAAPARNFVTVVRAPWRARRDAVAQLTATHFRHAPLHACTHGAVRLNTRH